MLIRHSKCRRKEMHTVLLVDKSPQNGKTVEYRRLEQTEGTPVAETAETPFAAMSRTFFYAAADASLMAVAVTNIGWEAW